MRQLELDFAIIKEKQELLIFLQNFWKIGEKLTEEYWAVSWLRVG